MDTHIVRIFNTYGPRLQLNDGRVISNFMKQALTGQDLTVYGEGSQTRSRGLTLPGHSHSANQRVHLFWDGKWHLRARNSGYSRDDFLLGADTPSAKLSRRARYLAPNAYL